MRLRHLLVPILLLCLTAQAPVPQSKLDAIIARGTIRVGFPGDYRPFALQDKVTGRYEGLDVDMAQNLATALGVKLEIVPTAWGALIPDLAADKFDIGMGGISVTLERQKSAFFSLPTMRTGKAAIARCENAAKFDTLADIDKPGVKVITNPGGTNEKFDRANLKTADIVVFPTNATIFEELAAGHADVMITDSVETLLQQKLHKELCAIHPDKPFDFGELAYLLPRDVVFDSWIDQWLHISFENGDYQKLVSKYLQ